MSAGGYEYTFYFAWVPPGTLTWDASLARFDENVFSLLIEHDEGQIPTALIEVVNPRIGLINPSRPYWAWLSYSYEACGPLPLFYGRLFGIPSELENNTLQLRFIARPQDYIYQKQQVARSLKVLPNYDRIFFDSASRDDPDAILEGWSALYHSDRLNHRVSASDILLGEDGTVTFAPQDVFYDSVKQKTLQPPLRAINVKMDVAWQQQYRGTLDMGQWAWPTLGSDAFVGEWPKTGSSLGGGWFAGVSWAGERDPSIAEQMILAAAQRTPQVGTIHFEYINQEKTHQTGDVMTHVENYTPPFTGSTSVLVYSLYTFGLIMPNAEDLNGDPDPVNRPASITQDWFCYRQLGLNFDGKQSLATLSLIYEANRARSERLEMTVTADVQPVEIDPTVAESTEQITLKSGDLSLPIIDFLNWSSVGMGGSVTTGQIIFPDNPLVPGQTSSQIAISGGTTGMVQPTFSNISGQTTVDGSVTWASLGVTQPPEQAQDWVRLAKVPLGALILPKPVSGVPNLNAMQVPGKLNFPPTGVAVALYSVFCANTGGPGDTMYEVSAAGILGGLSAAPATLRTFTNPSGAFLYIAVQAGETGEFHPTFNEPTGAQTTDGSVIWQSLGPVELPIGGTPGMTPANTYFPSDRGKQSLLHGFARARAKLRKRSRAAQVDFDSRFEVVAQLSCRMNGTIPDKRLPGGQVSGKIISYKLMVNGDTGEVKGTVSLGCSVGKTAIGFTAPPALLLAPMPFALGDGIPSYVGVTGPVNGYVIPGYQKYYANGTALHPGESGFLPPGTPPPQDGDGASTPPTTPPNWPTVPPGIPPITCPPLASPWAAGPSPPAGADWSYTPP